MKKFLALVMAMAMVLALVACGGTTNNGSTSNNTSGNNTSDNTANDTADTGDTGDLITVGFAQVGHESDWRTASTKSAQDVFSEANGYELSFGTAITTPLLSWKLSVTSSSRVWITSSSTPSFPPVGTLF